MLKIQLKLLEELPGVQSGEIIQYGVNEFDSETGVLSAICALLEEHKLAEFHICGFGQEKWPVDVGVDLCTIIEELPLYCERVMSGEATIELDFYEQGTERLLEFSNIGTANIRVECSCRNSWQPDPSVEFITTSELHEILEGLGRNFHKGAFLFFPLLATNPLLADFWIAVDEFFAFCRKRST